MSLSPAMDTGATLSTVLLLRKWPNLRYFKTSVVLSWGNFWRWQISLLSQGQGWLMGFYLYMSTPVTLYTLLNICGSLYVNYISIKLLKNLTGPQISPFCYLELIILLCLQSHQTDILWSRRYQENKNAVHRFSPSCINDVFLIIRVQSCINRSRDSDE